ncbi:MAG: helix-turn-helix domain-containing protein [Dehalococcoidia bacterium]|nr:helix-turn-helix domain-containing protein [Dehalococcoidia bacterium]
MARRRRAAWTAERIAALRSELGLTQSDMADGLGVRQQTASEWETGRYLAVRARRPCRTEEPLRRLRRR